VSNKFLIVGLGNIGAEYVNTRHIGFKILDYFAKRTTFIQTVKLGALAGTNLKEELFSFFKYLHELKRESGAILDGQENIPLETSWSLLMI
jgi:PTH1 family peptidyl-tRNA hydrolase